MKIAQVLYGFGGGGAPNIVKLLSDGLVENGNDVHLICVNEQYSKEQKKILIGDDNRNMTYYELNRKEKTFGFKSFLNFLKIVKLQNFDIIHSHLFVPDLYVGLSNLINNKYKHFITIHNSKRYHSNLILNTLLRRSIFIKCSPIIKDYNHKKIFHTIPNGIDIDKFCPLNKLVFHKSNMGFEADDIILVSVGNLRPQKNYFFGIELVNKLVKKGYKNLRYLICGSGPMQTSISKKSWI